MVTAQRCIVELATVPAEFIPALGALVALCDYLIPALFAIHSESPRHSVIVPIQIPFSVHQNPATIHHTKAQTIPKSKTALTCLPRFVSFI
jgi:hypothetical protein